ncbi:sensor histidine kinase [Stackebrandtia nassauensis]|nr:HAMP domain-containing sensor histidine kinase [Stackebrandtia nassauensis]
MAMVLGAGAVMTALTYVLMRSSLRRRSFVHTDVDPDSPAGLPFPERFDELIERDRMTILSDLLVKATVALVVVSVLAAVLGWFVAGRVLRPIRQISAASRRLSAENLAERVPVRGPADELAELADTVNGMLDRIQRGVAERDRALASQRLFTANAAHELRTPLTTMRTAIDVTLDGEPDRDELLAMIADLDTTVERSRRTLDGLLLLAGSHAAPAEQSPVALDGLVAELLEAKAPAIAEHRIDVRRELFPAPALGDPLLLERLTGNLIDNAVRYNHPDGHIALRTGTADGRAFLRVANSGPHVAPESAPGLLEPFVRGGGGRIRATGGVGLGLSIVRAVVTAHDGDLSIAANPDGGLTVTVELAVDPAAATRTDGGRDDHVA